jgi:tetraacyldisaccharide 4'-kinase
MQAPAFWWRKAGLAAASLAPVAWLYGFVAARRMGQRGRAVGIPVVCIGNFTVGGAGKTPTALAVARMLTDSGERPVFLTRGYGGRLPGPVRVDADRHSAQDVGDEPLLLARVAPTLVARDRVAGAAAAQAAGASVIVMDDGFQNPSLAKQCSVLVIEGDRSLGNGNVIPAGPLRAPLGTQLGHAHALLTIGDGVAAAPVAASAARRGLSLFRGRLVPDPATAAACAGSPVLAFTGIGNPEKFFATLDAAGIAAPVRRAFPDHHRYSASEAAALIREAEQNKLSLLTTEKDAARLTGDRALTALRERVRVLPVTLAIDQEDAFRQFLLTRLRGDL